MNEKELTSFEQAIIERLDSIEKELREIKSYISRIDGNVEILATSMGVPYSSQYRRVYQFGRKVS